MKTMQQWEKELTGYASKWVHDEFGVKLTIPIEFNGRLRSTYGQFWHDIKTGKAIRITIAKKLVEANLEDEIYDTLRHELIHYALHQLKKPFRDRDIEFVNACHSRNVSLYGETPFADKHIYGCKCGIREHRVNKISDRRLKGMKYVRCGHEVKYLGRESDLEVKFK